MGTIWVKHFTGGLDSRRLPECSPGGSLTVLQDAHINRGGEIEQRAAFVETYDLPTGLTKSMAHAGPQTVVFSERDMTNQLPVGVVGQQLVHPLDATLRLADVLSFEYFASKLYVIAQFEDGGVYHYYDGARVTDWNDKRARSRIKVTGGQAGGSVSAIVVNGVDILGAIVPYTGDAASMALALADQINEFLSVPDYVAAAFDDTVAILAMTDGTAANGYAVVVTASLVSFVAPAAMAGGLSEPGAYATGSFTVTGAAGGSITDLFLNNVQILGQTVAYVTDDATTATAVSDQINAFASTPDYTATATGNVVTVSAVDVGATPNSYPFAARTAGAFNVAVVNDMHGGINPTYQSGSFVRSGNKKLFSLTGGETHFSGLQTPTLWFGLEATGAGFIDMSNEASNSETMTSLAKYQNYYAFFSGRTIQVWYIDPDPSLNKQIQVLANTGTSSPRSVVQYGDNDVFYLDESGVRSLRARDASNAAATTDTGVPIDTLIVADLQKLTESGRQGIISVIEPSSGRYWLAIGQTIYVFSSFQEASINAWSTYTLPFPVEDMFVNPQNRRVYVRSGDTIYVYGGLGRAPVYDDTSVVAWLPYMDADHPTEPKDFEGIDVACRGQWELRAALEVSDENASDIVARIDGTTFNGPDIFGVGQFSHIQMRLKSLGRPDDGGPVILSALAIHYQGDDPGAA